MSVPRAVPIVLTASVRARLKQRANGHKTPHRDRQRALIVLLAARGWPNARIARYLGVSQDMVRTWRGRFAQHGLAGLADRPRSGRPRRITELERAQVCALACQLPAESGVPLARWSAPELATELVDRGLTGLLSASSVRRILAEHPVKPWRYQSWLFPRDPQFTAKATVVLDLYQGSYQGQPLGPHDRILCIDAKPSIQARARCHPSTPPKPGQVMRLEHEYQRMGALALLAALDIHTGKVIATTPPTTGITPFMTLIDQIMTQPRYRDAPQVFVIVDNGSDHRGQAAINRLRDRYPNCIMTHTPVHASWLNQAEIFFSIIQRKVITPNDFTNTEHLAEVLQAFITRYNTTATPFTWKYTAADLERHLTRIPPAPAPADAPAKPLQEAA
jgi:transposase